MADHAVNIRQLSNGSRRSGRVLAITSGKGGVGKTNVAANLALCMAATQKRILLWDADISLGNLDLVMNIQSRYNISHVVSGYKRVEEIIQQGPQGLRVICGASGLDQLADISQHEQHRLLQYLSGLQDQSDLIVVDTAAGIANSVVSFCLAADQVLVVTTPEAAAMTDAYGMIKVLVRKHFHGPISVLVNMAQNTAEGKRTYQRLADVADRFLQAKLYYAGTLLKDEHVCSAVRARKPVVLAYPRSQISASFAALAARLTDMSQGRNAHKGFFRRVIKWLN